MEYKGLERRACIRFEIPGATVNYKKKKILFTSNTYEEEFCPVLDISRGGLRFLGQKKLKINQELILAISVPGERAPLLMKGKVRWFTPNPGKSYRYQIGVQFHPYGEKRNQNYPGNLVKIIALEQKFAPEEELQKYKEKEKE